MNETAHDQQPADQPIEQDDLQTDQTEGGRHETPTPGAQDQQDDLQTDTGDTAARRARKEAKGLRDRLRATEEERDHLATQVTEYHRAEAARVAQAHGLADGADLWAGGIDLADVLDDTGRLDPAAVKTATERVLAEHPGWAARRYGTPPRSRPIAHLQPGASPVRLPGVQAGPSWADVLGR